MAAASSSLLGFEDCFTRRFSELSLRLQSQPPQPFTTSRNGICASCFRSTEEQMVSASQVSLCLKSQSADPFIASECTSCSQQRLPFSDASEPIMRSENILGNEQRLPFSQLSLRVRSQDMEPVMAVEDSIDFQNFANTASHDPPLQSFSSNSEIPESESISSCSFFSGGGHCSSGHCDVSGEPEVESRYEADTDCKSFLDPTIPVRQGLSKFFSGQARSFSCLQHVVSIKDLAKPENPYTRKRKSFAALNGSLDRTHLFPIRTKAGMKKSSRNKSTLAVAVTMIAKDTMLNGNESNHHKVSSELLNGYTSRSFSFPDFPKIQHILSLGCS